MRETTIEDELREIKSKVNNGTDLYSCSFVDFIYPLAMSPIILRLYSSKSITFDSSVPSTITMSSIGIGKLVFFATIG